MCSKAATSALLTSQEEAWIKRVSSKRNESGFTLSNSSYESSCLHLRYIDDVILASRRWCRTCLVVSAVRSVLRLVVLTWLDMVLDCTNGAVRPKHKEVTVPPPWGTHLSCLRPLFFNALRRSCLVSSSVQSAKLRMMHVLLDFAKHGWPPRKISAVVFTTFRQPFREVILFLRTCVRTPAFRQLLVDASTALRS